MPENGQVEGRNAVMELIDSEKDINKIFVLSRKETCKNKSNTFKSKSKRNCYCRNK